MNHLPAGMLGSLLLAASPAVEPHPAMVIPFVVLLLCIALMRRLRGIRSVEICWIDALRRKVNGLFLADFFDFTGAIAAAEAAGAKAGRHY